MWHVHVEHLALEEALAVRGEALAKVCGMCMWSTCMWHVHVEHLPLEEALAVRGEALAKVGLER